MTLVRNRGNKKVVISNNSQGFHLPFISKSYTIDSGKTTDIYSENHDFTRSTGSLRYLLKHNFERKRHVITTRGRSSTSSKKRNFFKGRIKFDRDLPDISERYSPDRNFPLVGNHINSMDYQKVSVSPPGYRSKSCIFK